MARAGLLTTRRDGTRIYYRLASERVGELWAALRDVAGEHVAGLERLADAYLGDRDELAAMPRRREVLVLDVRPQAECAAGHITGARSVPHRRAPPPPARSAQGRRCRGLLPRALLRLCR